MIADNSGTLVTVIGQPRTHLANSASYREMRCEQSMEPCGRICPKMQAENWTELLMDKFI